MYVVLFLYGGLHLRTEAHVFLHITLWFHIDSILSNVTEQHRVVFVVYPWFYTSFGTLERVQQITLLMPFAIMSVLQVGVFQLAMILWWS